MSSVGLALGRTTSVSQEFAQEPAPNRISISPTSDAAISGPGSNSVLSDLPEDTVTISNAPLPAPRNQPTKGGVLHGGNSVVPETSLGAAGSYNVLNAKSGSNPSAVSSAMPEASKTAAAQASSVTAQEQLQQLDRTLQQLGINPESVSLIRRVELIRLANNPAALEEYFQSPSASTTGSASQGPSSAAAPTPPASATVSASGSSSYVAATNQSPKSTADVAHLNVSA